METRKIYEFYYNIPDFGNYYYAINVEENNENLSLENYLVPTEKVITRTPQGIIINRSILNEILIDNENVNNNFDIKDCIQYIACLHINREFKKDLGNVYLQGFLWGLYYGS